MALIIHTEVKSCCSTLLVLGGFFYMCNVIHRFLFSSQNFLSVTHLVLQRSESFSCCERWLLSKQSLFHNLELQSARRKQASPQGHPSALVGTQGPAGSSVVGTGGHVRALLLRASVRTISAVLGTWLGGSLSTWAPLIRRQCHQPADVGGGHFSWGSPGK